MCGIFGGIALKNPLPMLNLMGDILVHRGPDDRGFYYKNTIALGHRRLSIIDLFTGHQPMMSSDSKQVIVYNGEIYNFKEIKGTLIQKGYKFSTESDTEVIINAYREWGYDCLDRLDGMFAFALWDETTQKLWLVRDRIGKKPLYYLHLSGAFYFASEAKALWKLPECNSEYDFTAIDQYLTFRYVPGDRTFFKGIRKLPAGHWMLVDKDSRIIRIEKWWDMPAVRDCLDNDYSGGISDVYEEFNSLFSSAVKKRLISDVPLGLFLSSGIDSASIAFEMAKVSKPAFFSIGFGERTDELKATKGIADELKADYHQIIMKGNDFEFFPKAVAAMDEPYGDPIILPTYLLSKMAAQKVKVILTGDGADEVMGTYIHQEYFRKLSLGVPQIFFKLLSCFISIFPVKVLDILFHYPDSMGKDGKDRVKKLLKSYPDNYDSYMNFASVFTEADKEGLYSHDFRTKIGLCGSEFTEEMRKHFSDQSADPFDKIIHWDLKHWFPNQTLMKLDRLSMAHSLEGRCPYADYQLIEFLLKKPIALFKKITNNKQLIRKYYHGLADGILKRKQAFYLPLHNMFDKQTKELICATLTKKRISELGLFNYSFVEKLFNNRKYSSLLADKQIMALVVLVLWMDKNKN